MNKIFNTLLILFIGLAVSFNLNAQTVNYRLSMTDQLTDGWDSQYGYTSYLRIFRNGTLIVESTGPYLNAGPLNVDFTAQDGDAMLMTYQDGIYDSEHNWTLTDMNTGLSLGSWNGGAYDGGDYAPTNVLAWTADYVVIVGCQYTFRLTDTFGDGWNGNTLSLTSNGAPFTTLTLPSGTEGIYNVTLIDGTTVAARFNAIGSWTYEPGYQIFDAFGNMIVNRPAPVTNGTTDTWLVNCPQPCGVELVTAIPTNFVLDPGMCEALIGFDLQTTGDCRASVDLVVNGFVDHFAIANAAFTQNNDCGAITGDANTIVMESLDPSAYGFGGANTCTFFGTILMWQAPGDAEITFDYSIVNEGAADYFGYSIGTNWASTVASIPNLQTLTTEVGFATGDAGTVTVNVASGDYFALIAYDDSYFTTGANPGAIYATVSNFAAAWTQIDYVPRGTVFPVVINVPIGQDQDIEYCTDMFIEEDNVCYTFEGIDVTEYPYPVTTIACNDNVQISLDENCEAEVNADMILEGGPYGCYDNYTVVIEGVVGNVVTAPGEYVVGVYDAAGNNCWGSITVMDKLGPDLVCADDIEIECYEAVPYVAPTVLDNCNNYAVTYVDYVVENYCAQFSEVVYRTWTVTDRNNGMTASCVQTISKRRATLANLGWPLNWDGVVGHNPMIECSNTTYPVNQWGNPHPSYTGGPTGIGWSPTSATGACGTIEVFYTDRVFTSDCGPKILRDWTIIDDCTGTIVTHTQIIRITDSIAPLVCGPEEILAEQELITISTNAWSCTADYVVPKPLLCDNCDTNPTYTVEASAGTVVYVPATKNWIVFGLPEGIHGITYVAVDWCGNVREHTFFVQVLDLIPPMAACEQYKQVSLTFDGTTSVAKVWAQSFDSGSHDHGCGPVWFKVWRNDNGCMPFNCDNQACNQQWFDDYVIYCCGDAQIMTTLRVFDVNPGPGPINPNRMLIGGDLYGHFNDCMTTVDVQEKVPPFMACEDITITCEDNIHPDHTGYPTALATCGTPEFDWVDDLSNLNTCNIGYITRTWEVLKADRSSYTPKITCKQRINVIETLPFDPLTIVFPYISQEHCLKTEPIGGTPTWETNPCNIVDASLIKVDTFRFVEGACYKILREWAVVDWCTYKANTGAEWNLDEYRYISSNRRAILDPAKFTIADRDGYYRFTEVIMVYDNTAANIHVEDACIGIATCVTAPETHRFTATSSEEDEDCGGEYEWTYVIHDVCCGAVIQFSSNNNAYKGANFQGGVSGRSSADKLKQADAEFLLLPSLAVGEYRVTWTLRDGCGNVNEEYQYITVADKKAPTPFMVDVSTATMTNCMVEITARFFDKGACNNNCLASYDNCADVLYFTFTPVLPKIDPTWTLDAYGLYYFNPTTGAKSNRAAYLAGTAHSWDPVKNTSGKVFTGPTGQVNVDVYVWDKFALNEDCDDGNYDFATILLTINSIDDDCTGFLLSGMISNKAKGDGINNVEVRAEQNGESTYDNTVNGAYDMKLGSGVQTVTPSKRDDYSNGLNTLDLVLIQRHLLGLGALNADQLVAADANANGAVTGADIKQLRDLILGVSTSLPSNDSWVFTPKSTQIDLQSDASLNFSGIKVGDINGDATSNFDGTTVATRNANVINMVVNDAAVEAGNVVEVSFTAENFNNVRGTQMTLNLNGLSFAGVVAGEMNVTTENFGLVRDGIVTMSWNNANGVSVADGAVLFTLKLNATSNGNLSKLMSAGSQVTAAEAYTNEALNVNGLNVTFRGAEEVVFELFQNEPNPFAEKTMVGFNLPEAGEYTLTVFDVTGRVINTINGQGQKGYNSQVLNSTDLSAGVLYYQLDSNNFTATKKMIVIK